MTNSRETATSMTNVLSITTSQTYSKPHVIYEWRAQPTKITANAIHDMVVLIGLRSEEAPSNRAYSLACLLNGQGNCVIPGIYRAS
eukprot:7146309-Pyramimonas_sp.AAC.1